MLMCFMSLSLWIALLIIQMMTLVSIVRANMFEIIDPATDQRILYFTPNNENKTSSSSSTTTTTTKGVVVLFHGCSHSGEDWDKLPIERMIVSKILDAGYVALALTSLDRRHRCWSENDLPRTSSAMKHFLSKGHLPAGKPIHLLGIQSYLHMSNIL